MAAPAIGISLLLLALGSLGGWYVHRLQTSTARLVKLDVSTIRAVEQLVFGIQDIRMELSEYLLTSDRSHLEALAGSCRETEYWLEETEKLADDQDEIALAGQIRSGYGRLAGELQRLARAPGGAETRRAVEQLAGEAAPREVLAPAQQLLAYEDRLIRHSGDANQRMASWMTMVLWLLGACGAAAGLVAGFGIARGVSRSIVRLQVLIRAVSGKLEEVIGPVDLAPSGNIENLDLILRRMADHVGTVVDRLQQSRLEVLRAEQMAALGQLAAGLAHELRNPLTAMKLLIQSAVEAGDCAALGGRDLAVLGAETTRLERSIQTFLDFARPPTLEKRPGDARQAIRQTVALIEARVNRQGVELGCDLPEQPLVVEADHEQLRQVLLNLLLNALDCLPNGGRIRIAAGPAEGPAGAGIVITVADSGPGIPDQLAERIFDPYVSTKDSGLGLGLAICRRIVQTHGGDVVAGNAPEGGAVFTVRLPRSSSASDETNSATDSAADETK
jgi:signal transduction histidine kinase